LINLFNDDAQDRGIAGVDIFKMNAEGKAIEYWDVLPEIGDPNKAALANGMYLEGVHGSCPEECF